MDYFSKVNQNEFKIGVREKSVLSDGKNINCMLSPINKDGLHLLFVDGKTYEVFCHKKDGKYQVAFSNFHFSVSVQDEKSRELKKLIEAESEDSGQLEIKAPMPGLIVKVNVNEGDSVEKGQSLLIIEAMKMENEICAPSDGKIAQLSAQEKSSVEKEAVLIVLQK